MEIEISKVGIILVLYKQKQHLELLYKSLAGQSFKNFKIYFVDNNTGDDETICSREINAKYKLDISYLKPGYNSGFAAGNNLGAKQALADNCSFVFFLNNDVELDKNCVAELVKSLENDSSAGVAAPLIIYGKPSGKEGLIQEFGAKADFDKYKISKFYEGKDLQGVKSMLPETMEVDLVSGGAMFVRAVVLKKAGLWEEIYFAYGDEIDFAKRVKEAGYNTIVNSSAILLHNHPWGKNNRQGYYFEYYMIQRNKFLYFHKYKKYFRLFVSLDIDLLKFPWRLLWFIKICDFSLGMYYLKGTLDGILNKKGNPKLNFIN